MRLRFHELGDLVRHAGRCLSARHGRPPSVNAVGMGEDLEPVGPGQGDQGDARRLGQRHGIGGRGRDGDQHRRAQRGAPSAPCRSTRGWSAPPPPRARSRCGTIAPASLSSALWRPHPRARRRARAVPERRRHGRRGSRRAAAAAPGRAATAAMTCAGVMRNARRRHRRHLAQRLLQAVDAAQPAADRPGHRAAPRGQPRLGLGRQPDLHIMPARRSRPPRPTVDLVRRGDALRSAQSHRQNPPDRPASPSSPPASCR